MRSEKKASDPLTLTATATATATGGERVTTGGHGKFKVSAPRDPEDLPRDALSHGHVAVAVNVANNVNVNVNDHGYVSASFASSGKRPP